VLVASVPISRVRIPVPKLLSLLLPYSTNSTSTLLQMMPLEQPLLKWLQTVPRPREVSFSVRSFTQIATKTEIWSFTLISELRSGCKCRPSSWKFIVDYGSSVLLNFVLPRRPGLWSAPLCICLPWVISSKRSFLRNI